MLGSSCCLQLAVPVRPLTIGTFIVTADAPESNMTGIFSATNEIGVGILVLTGVKVGIGVVPAAKTGIAAMKQTRLLVNNPREMSKSDALAIYRAAW